MKLKRETWEELAFLLILFFVVAFFFFTPQSAASQIRYPHCKPKKEVFEFLGRYGELPIFRGVSKDGHLTVVFLNRVTGSWTAVVILPNAPPDKSVCIVDLGDTGAIELPKESNPKTFY